MDRGASGSGIASLPAPGVASDPSNIPTQGVPRAASRPGSNSVGDEIAAARRDARDLDAAANRSEVDCSYIVRMLDTCKEDQERLQIKLNNALEHADGMEHLDDFIAVNDELVSLDDWRMKKAAQKFMHGSSVELTAASQMGSNHLYAQVVAAVGPGDGDGCSIKDLLADCCTMMLDGDKPTVTIIHGLL